MIFRKLFLFIAKKTFVVLVLQFGRFLRASKASSRKRSLLLYAN